MLLLDTHAYYWFITEDPKLPDVTKEMIEINSNTSRTYQLLSDRSEVRILPGTSVYGMICKILSNHSIFAF